MLFYILLNRTKVLRYKKKFNSSAILTIKNVVVGCGFLDRIRFVLGYINANDSSLVALQTKAISGHIHSLLSGIRSYMLYFILNLHLALVLDDNISQMYRLLLVLLMVLDGAQFTAWLPLVLNELIPWYLFIGWLMKFDVCSRWSTYINAPSNRSSTKLQVLNKWLTMWVISPHR